MSIIPLIVQVTRNHDAQKQDDGLVWQRHRDISPGLSDTVMHFLCAMPLPFEDRGYVNHYLNCISTIHYLEPFKGQSSLRMGYLEG